jgi:ribosomal protein S9
MYSFFINKNFRGLGKKKNAKAHIFLLSTNKQNLNTCRDLKITQNMADIMLILVKRKSTFFN